MRAVLIALVLSAATAQANMALPPKPSPEHVWDDEKWAWVKPADKPTEPTPPKPAEEAAKGLTIAAGMIGLGLLARWLTNRRRPSSGLAPT